MISLLRCHAPMRSTRVYGPQQHPSSPLQLRGTFERRPAGPQERCLAPLRPSGTRCLVPAASSSRASSALCSSLGESPRCLSRTSAAPPHQRQQQPRLPALADSNAIPWIPPWLLRPRRKTRGGGGVPWDTGAAAAVGTAAATAPPARAAPLDMTGVKPPPADGALSYCLGRANLRAAPRPRTRRVRASATTHSTPRPACRQDGSTAPDENPNEGPAVDPSTPSRGPRGAAGTRYPPAHVAKGLGHGVEIRALRAAPLGWARGRRIPQRRHLTRGGEAPVSERHARRRGAREGAVGRARRATGDGRRTIAPGRRLGGYAGAGATGGGAA